MKKFGTFYASEMKRVGGLGWGDGFDLPSGNLVERLGRLEVLSFVKRRQREN